MFEVGGGPALISYGSLADAYFSAAQSYGADRSQLFIDLDAGYALGKKLYLTGGIDGGGDRFSQGSSYIQINSYLYRIGLRYYPFETGLLLGLDGGAARLVISSNVGIGSTSDWGYGAGGTIAYDFTRKQTGFGLVLGVRTEYLTVGGSPISDVALYLNLLWK
jgi:hypothetical protein